MPPRSQARLDDDEVQAANLNFYRALQAMSLDQMESVWLREDWVKCIHPGWNLVVGWKDVRRSWEHIFNSTREMRVSIGAVLADVLGDVACVSCVENVTSLFEEGFASARIAATNIFVRRSERWLMVHHITSPIAERTQGEISATVQ